MDNSRLEGSTELSSSAPPAQSASDAAEKKKRKRNRQDKLKTKAAKRARAAELAAAAGGGSASSAKRVNDRRYSDELEAYLSDWNKKIQGVTNTWKFNKRLQYWAIDNCFDAKSIDAALFAALLPYYASIQGSIRSQFIETCNKLIENYKGISDKAGEDNDNSGDDDDSNSDDDSSSDDDENDDDDKDSNEEASKKALGKSSATTSSSGGGVVGGGGESAVGGNIARDLSARDRIMLHPSASANSRAKEILSVLN